MHIQVSVKPTELTNHHSGFPDKEVPDRADKTSAFHSRQVNNKKTGTTTLNKLSSQDQTSHLIQPARSSDLLSRTKSIHPSTAAIMAGTQALSSSTLARISPEMSSSIKTTEASAGLSEITKEPSTSLKTASSSTVQTTSTATLPSSSVTDGAETDTSRHMVVSSTPAEPVATPSSPSTESHQEQVDPQDRKRSKRYADLGQPPLPPGSQSHFTLTQRKLLKGYSDQTKAIYDSYAHQAGDIKQQNQQIMAAIPA
ncbi:hypothetical protein, partial [Endozoicomonas sp. YOMI1]|uniref:hypothetical protein n=1 Tax=Endozoicomonas sp. YOMI1 TaxID=2828739 RepID=UPI0021494743